MDSEVLERPKLRENLSKYQELGNLALAVVQPGAYIYFNPNVVLIEILRCIESIAVRF